MAIPTAYDIQCLQALMPELETRLRSLRQQVVQLGDAAEQEAPARFIALDLAINDTLALLDVIVPPEADEEEDSAIEVAS